MPLLSWVMQSRQERCYGYFFPAQTLPLFHVFAPCFTAPSFAYFQAYVWALMVVAGRKCLTRLARCVCFHQRDLSRWERFLAVSRWSLTAVTERLVTLVVAKLGAQLQCTGPLWWATIPPWWPRAPSGCRHPKVARPQRQCRPRGLSGRPPREPGGPVQPVGPAVAVLAPGHAVGPGAPRRAAMDRRRRCRAHALLGGSHRGDLGGATMLGGGGGPCRGGGLLRQGAIAQRVAGARERCDEPLAPGCRGLG